MTNTNPFKGRPMAPAPPMRVLHRFTKPGGHTAEIRERVVTQFRAIEYLVFVDGNLVDSQLFHNGREVEYPAAVDTRTTHFLNDGWTPDPVGVS